MGLQGLAVVLTQIVVLWTRREGIAGSSFSNVSVKHDHDERRATSS
jgi:hypothetical protein